MRRVGAHRAFAAESEAGIGAAFGAMAVHDVGAGCGKARHDVAQRGEVAGTGLAPHRVARQAERELRA